jgi:uncharacterized membrane protein YkvA (DUF1232 family)
MRRIGKALQGWAHAAKRDVLALYLAARDPRVPRGVKVLALAIAAYALSPIDLIPDFIPVIGYLDELILLPAALWLVARLIEPSIMSELRNRAAEIAERPASPMGAVIVVTIWILAAGLLMWTFWPVAAT